MTFPRHWCFYVVSVNSKSELQLNYTMKYLISHWFSPFLWSNIGNLAIFRTVPYEVSWLLSIPPPSLQSTSTNLLGLVCTSDECLAPGSWDISPPTISHLRNMHRGIRVLIRIVQSAGPGWSRATDWHSSNRTHMYTRTSGQIAVLVANRFQPRTESFIPTKFWSPWWWLITRFTNCMIWDCEKHIWFTVCSAGLVIHVWDNAKLSTECGVSVPYILALLAVKRTLIRVTSRCFHSLSAWFCCPHFGFY